MSRAWFALAVVAVIGVFCLAFGQEQPLPRRPRAKPQERNGQPEPGAPRQEVARPARGQVGRYQMAVRDGASGSGAFVVVCDSTTGRCWFRALPGGQGWRDLGTPGDVPAIDPAAIEAPRLDPPEGSKIDGDAPRFQPLPPAFGSGSPRAADLPPALPPPPPVVRPANAVPVLQLPSLPNDLPRAVPGELPPRLPGQESEPN